MITYFDFIQETGENFTPSAKIIEFAKNHNLNTSNRYGSTILHYESGDAVFHHYEIEPKEEGFEKVTIYMEDI